MTTMVRKFGLVFKMTCRNIVQYRLSGISNVMLQNLYETLASVLNISWIIEGRVSLCHLYNY